MNDFVSITMYTCKCGKTGCANKLCNPCKRAKLYKRLKKKKNLYVIGDEHTLIVDPSTGKTYSTFDFTWEYLPAELRKEAREWVSSLPKRENK